MAISHIRRYEADKSSPTLDVITRLARAKEHARPSGGIDTNVMLNTIKEDPTDDMFLACALEAQVGDIVSFFLKQLLKPKSHFFEMLIGS